MNKRKILALAIIAFMCALIVGGTSAYFTFSDRAHNVITTSGIAIELIEDTNQVGVDGRAIPFTNVTDAMPGDVISKIPKVKNIDDGDAYIRMRVTANVNYPDGESNRISPDMFNLDIDATNWQSSNGYYYYNQELSKNQITAPLFTTVTIPDNLSDQYQGATFSLDVYAEAVQVANNGSNAMEAKGWPKE
jgi:predicted ribosomally synthesized peptide with SipW-like signal peptide